MEVSSEPSAASSGASGADVVDEQSLCDFFMNLSCADDHVLIPPDLANVLTPLAAPSGAGDGHEGEASVGLDDVGGEQEK